MKNWSVDITKLKKSPKKYRLWRLEQLINYGLDPGEKIDRQELVKNWPALKDRLDPQRREFIQFLLWQ
jgi:hypothetical protein